MNKQSKYIHLRIPKEIMSNIAYKCLIDKLIYAIARWEALEIDKKTLAQDDR